MTFFCNTQQGEGHRFIVGNVKSWTSLAEKENPGSYNGPDFEDLEDKLQEALDEYLGTTTFCPSGVSRAARG